MSESVLMTMLRDTYACFLDFDYEGFVRGLETSRAGISELGDPPALLGEWTLLAAFTRLGNAEELLLGYRDALALLRGRSKIVPRGTPMLLKINDPFGVFWQTPGTADVTAQLLDEAESLWERMTGGGQGTAALFRAKLAYYRGELQTAKALASGAYRLAEKFGQKIEQLTSAEVLGLLARHGLGGSYTDDALAFVRRCCEDEKEPAISQLAQIIRSNIYLSMGILSETPDWIKNGDFGAISDSGHPGWRIIGGKLHTPLLPAALLVRTQYLTYAGKYAEALNVIDSAQLVFRIDGPLVMLYFDFWREGCYNALGEPERAKDYMRALLAGCAPDGLWLIPGEREAALPLLMELGSEYGEAATEKLKSIGSGLLDKMGKLRAAYIHDCLPETLTRRERQVLELVSGGHTNAQIAQKLSVGEETVKTHLKHAFDKLGVSNRTQVATALGKIDGSTTAIWAKNGKK